MANYPDRAPKSLDEGTPLGLRVERKYLVTIAEWEGTAHYTYTKLTAEPSTFTPANYYWSNDGVWTAGASGDTWSSHANWYSRSATTSTLCREILGVRTEDSSIEFNADIATSTDIRGITYTDVNKTEPQQSFDPFYLLGGSKLGDFLSSKALQNQITSYSNAFNVYIVAMYEDEGDNTGHEYRTVKHSGCSIIPTSIGGDSFVNMPIEVHYSNDITTGTIDKIAEDFEFTPGTWSDPVISA